MKLHGAWRGLLSILAVTAVAGIIAGAWSPVLTRSDVAEPGLILAKMVEKEDYFQYGTDTPAQKSPQDLAAEEKEKQERSWQLLERTEIYQDLHNPPPPPKDPGRRK